MKYRLAASVAVVSLLATVAIASAWTGPTASPPSNNVAAPLNIGSTAQIKNGIIGVNGLAVFGNSILQASSYLNWGATAGSAGYGLRDNGGSLEYKNSGGAWTAFTGGGFTGPYLPIYAAWGSQGTGNGGAAIYNDNGTYKSLMIVGNTSGGGSREVGVWDDLTVSNNLFVTNGEVKAPMAELGPSGGFLGFNLYYNGGWKYRSADYGYIIRHDGSDLGFYTVPSGTAGAGATPTQALTLSGTSVNVPGKLCLEGSCITSWSNAANLVAIVPIASGSGTVVFTGAPGSAPTFSGSTLILPSDTAYIDVELWGGGGGGDSGQYGGAGGGGGAYARALITSLASSYGYSVGAGGAGGGQQGSAGQSTTFGTIVAGGGVGAYEPSGGAGGIGGGSGASLYVTGGDGSGSGAYTYSSSQDNSLNIQNYFCSGTGGTAGGGGGGGGAAGCALYGNGGTGNAGRKPGGGGGGSVSASSATGGSGATGRIVINVYEPPSGNDYAEIYPVNPTSIAPGDIVAPDANNPGSLTYAQAAGAPAVGVVSTKPGYVLGDEKSANGRPVALSGRVPVKVSLEGGAIAVGDRIAPSTEPGVGKKAGPFDESIGVALSSYDGTQGNAEVMVFLTLQKGIDRAGLAETIAQTFSNAANAIHDLYVGIVHSQEVDTKTLCVSDDTGAKTCVTKAQLDKLLSSASHS